MSSCSTYTEFKHTSPTDNDLNLIYGNGNNPGLLPLQQDTDRENGMLKLSTVKTIVSNLKKSGVIPTLTSDTELFIQKQNSLIHNIKSEYCFYYSRYTYSLQKLLKSISESKEDNKYLELTQRLNKKMSDLIQIMNGVNEELLLSDTNMKNGIKTFDKEIKQMHTKLVEQNKIISSSEAVTKINKEMVKYTEEKRRYTDNLLNLYSVLNIVALSLLVYVYKSAGE